MAAAYGLKPFNMPSNIKIVWLGTADLIETTFASLMTPLDLDSEMSLSASVDAEWNLSRTSGVSIFQVAPHSDPQSIFVMPVSCFCPVIVSSELIFP